MKPEAILFDEPTSALDPRMAAEVISVIADLAKIGQTMIVVTHAMGFARNVSHTVHVMHAGRVAESGPPQQIFDDPREEITRLFWRKRERIEAFQPTTVNRRCTNRALRRRMDSKLSIYLLATKSLNRRKQREQSPNNPLLALLPPVRNWLGNFQGGMSCGWYSSVAQEC